MSKLSMGSGILTSLQEIVSGTGRFEGASGTLYNNAKDVKRTFCSYVIGKLCLPAQGNFKQEEDADWLDNQRQECPDTVPTGNT